MSASEPSAISPAEALASALISGRCAVPANLTDSEREALAWALKDAALACWNTNQAQVVTIERIMHQLLPPENAASSSPIKPLHHSVSAYAAIAQGRMSDADALLQIAAQDFRALGLPAAAAQTQIPRVLVLCMQGKLDDAEQCGIVARDHLVDLGETHAASRVSLNLGQLSWERSDFRKAVAHFEAAIRGFAETKDHERALQSRIGLAEAIAATGELGRALQFFSAARTETVSRKWRVLTALCDELAAMIQLAQGDFGAALAGLERARREYEQLRMPQHLANAQRRLGQAYLDLRLLPEATAVLHASIDRFVELEMHLEAAWARVDLAKALAGQCIDDPRIEAELSLAENIFAPESQLAGQATAVLTRAERAMTLGDFDLTRELAIKSESLFLQLGMIANAIGAKALLAECEWRCSGASDARSTFENLLASARERNLLSVELRALTHLGYIGRQEGDPLAARRQFEHAISIIEEQRHRLYGDELRHALLQATLAPYLELLRLALDEVTNDASATAALRALERFRARALADRLGSVANSYASGNAALDALYQRLTWSQRRLRQLQDDGEDIEAASEEISSLENEYLETLRRAQLTAAIPASPAIGASAADDTISKVQTMLGDDSIIVEFGAVDEELFAFVIDAKSVSIERHVAAWSAVTGAIHRVQFQIDAMRAGRLMPAQHVRQLDTRARQALHQLYKLIWSKFAKRLAHSRRILVVPHDKLGAISFASLYDGTRFLGELTEVAMVPSIAVATQVLNRKIPTIRSPLVLADTRRLAYTLGEAEVLRRLFPRASIHLDGHASIATLRRVGPTATSIHLACHGTFRSDNPMFSALELTDGNLSALDAEKLGLANPLVVLSACDSGVATVADGDEVFGLVRAFLIGGASRVVASLWPVDDETTVDWMTAFYGALHGGASPAAAVKRAQQEVRNRHPHPFHWAAFVLFGGW